MNKFLVCFLAALAGAATALPATGQDVAAASPRPVVIAPAQSALGEIIKAGLASSYYGAAKDSQAYQEAQKLYFFYGARHFEPLWLSQSAPNRRCSR